MRIISICFTLIFFYCVGKGRGIPAAVVIDVAGKLFSTIKFGTDVINLLQDNEENSSLGERVTAEIKDRIANSNAEILTSVLLQYKLERVDDVVISFHSALIDLENVLQADSQKEIVEYKQLYVSRFDQNNIITYIRFLPELLSYVVPGSSGALLDLFARSSRCNMTAFSHFKQYYMKLLSNGIALQISYLQITSKLPFNKTINRWISHTNKVSLEFDMQEMVCTDMFVEYASEDIISANDADIFWKSNNERYTWKINDVIFLKPFGTYQFLYLKYIKGYLFWHRSSINKMAFFTDKNDHRPKLSSSVLEAAKGILRSAINGKYDKDAAKHVGEAVEKYVNDQGYTVLALAVFFEGGDFSTEKIILSNETRILHLTLSDVQLTYCYKSGVECMLDFSNILGGQKEVNGVMKVFAYIDENEGTSANIDYITNSVDNRLPFDTLIYFFISYCFV